MPQRNGRQPWQLNSDGESVVPSGCAARLDPEAGNIHGLTAVGRATVARLQMNSAPQIAARRLWLRLGLFP